jgi:ABC-2 type transport system permease protein
MMSKIGLIIQREYTTRVKKRAFLILTILVPILIGGLSFFAMWLGMKEQKHFKVLVSDPRGLCESKIYIGQDENPPATFYFLEEMVLVEDFKEQEKYEEYDVFVALDPDVITNKTISAVYRTEPNLNTQKYLSNKLEMRLEEYFAIDEGISLEKFRKIKQPFKFVLKDIEEEAMSELKMMRQAVGFGFSVLIFVFLIVYAGQVMRGVLEEKTSRVVEIVVSSVKPFQLMMGKIIAVGLVGLTQFVIWIILVFIILISIQSFFMGELDPAAVQAMGEGQIGGELPLAVGNDNQIVNLIFEQINWPVLISLFIIYFLCGYLLYGSLFAMVGAASDSEADTQQLMIPVMMPLMFVYFISFSIMGNPDGPAAVWGSQIPFSSPIIMLQRVAAGSVQIWEVVISLVLLIGTFILTTYIAGKIYRVGILMYGKKASWKEMIKWIKHS